MQIDIYINSVYSSGMYINKKYVGTWHFAAAALEDV